MNFFIKKIVGVIENSLSRFKVVIITIFSKKDNFKILQPTLNDN